jgi:hypothetical protein
VRWLAVVLSLAACSSPSRPGDAAVSSDSATADAGACVDHGFEAPDCGELGPNELWRYAPMPTESVGQLEATGVDGVVLITDGGRFDFALDVDASLLPADVVIETMDEGLILRRQDDLRFLAFVGGAITGFDGTLDPVALDPFTLVPEAECLQAALASACELDERYRDFVHHAAHIADGDDTLATVNTGEDVTVEASDGATYRVTNRGVGYEVSGPGCEYCGYAVPARFAVEVALVGAP